MSCHDLENKLPKIAYKIWSRLSHVSWEINLTISWQSHQYWLAWPWHPAKIHERLILPFPGKVTNTGLHDLGKIWHESRQDSWEINLTISWQSHQYWLAWPWQDLAWIPARFMRDLSYQFLAALACMTLARLGKNPGKIHAWRTLAKTSCKPMQDLFKILTRIFSRAVLLVGDWILPQSFESSWKYHSTVDNL